MQRVLTILAGLAAIMTVAYLGHPEWADAAALFSPVRGGVVVGCVLAGLLAGELGRVLRLPRLVGYALVGIAAPAVVTAAFPGVAATQSDLVSHFDHFDILFGIALVLTGIAVGARIHLGELARNLREHASYALGHLVVIAPVAFGLFYVLGVGEFIPGLTSHETLIVCGILGTTAVTSSASANFGVAAELRAHGNFSNFQLQFAALKNVLVTSVVFALVLIFLVESGSGKLQQSAWISDLVLELSLSIGAGAVGAGCLLLVLRTIPNQILPVTVTLAVISVLAVPEHPVALLFGGVIAGAVATTGSRFSFSLTEALERTSPFFIGIAFVFVMVRVELATTPIYWAFAVVFVAARATALYAGTRAAGLLIGARRTFGDHLPSGMISQGLTAFFLLGLVVEHMPKWDGLLQAYMPLLVLNFIVGTVIHRLAVLQAGQSELPEHEEQEARPVVERVSRMKTAELPRSQPGGERDLGDEASLLPPAEFPEPDFESAELNRVVERIRRRIQGMQEMAVTTYYEPRWDFCDQLLDTTRHRLGRHVLETVEALRDEANPRRRRAMIRERRALLEEDLQDLIVVFGPATESTRLTPMLESLLENARRASQIQSSIRVREEASLREIDPGDGLYVRFRKRLHALMARIGPPPRRIVPLKALAMYHIAHRLADHIRPAVNLDGHFRLDLWLRVESAFRDVERMYERTLDVLDSEIAEDDDDVSAFSIKPDPDAARRESEALAEFDRRLSADEPQRSLEELPDVEPILSEESESEVTADTVVAYWAGRAADHDEIFDVMRQNVQQYDADTRRRLWISLSESYLGFVDALHVAGTFMLPTRRLDLNRRASDAASTRDELQDNAARWRQIAEAYLDRQSMYLHFRQMETRLRSEIKTTVEKVNRELSSHLTYYPAETSERCNDVVTTLNATFDAGASVDDLTEGLSQIRNNLSTFLQDDALHSIQDIREENRFGQILREFVHLLETSIEEQPAVFEVVDNSVFDLADTANPEDVETSEIPYRQILEKFLLQPCIGTYNEVDLEVRRTVDRVAAGLSEINRIVSFNLDAAASELRNDIDDPQTLRELVADFAVGGVSRAGEQAAHLLEDVQHEIDGIDHQLVDETIDHIRTVKRYLFDASMGRLEKLILDVDKDRAELQQRGFSALRAFTERALDSAEEWVQPLRSSVLKAREKLRLEEGTWAELQEDAGRASFEATHMESLPVAYRRLFTPVPVELPELFVSRNDAEERFAEALASWKNGRKVAIAVTGSLGNGKTSFVRRCLTDVLGEGRMLQWNIRERTTDVGDLCERLSSLFGFRTLDTCPKLRNAMGELDDPVIVVVDGLEPLFERTAGGCEALDAFLLLVAQAPRNVLWVLTANSALWDYLSTIRRADDHVTHVVDLEPLDRRGVEELIMRRHDVTGFELEFHEADEPTDEEREESESRQDRLRSRFFDRLYDATDGHVLLSLFYWLSAVEPGADESRLLAHPIEPLRVQHLRRLETDKLIGVGQLVLHEELTQKAYRQVLRLSEDEASRHIAFFEALNLVEPEPGRRVVYRVNPVLYHALSSAAHEHNII